MRASSPRRAAPRAGGRPRATARAPAARSRRSARRGRCPRAGSDTRPRRSGPELPGAGRRRASPRAAVSGRAKAARRAGPRAAARPDRSRRTDATRALASWTGRPRAASTAPTSVTTTPRAPCSSIGRRREPRARRRGAAGWHARPRERQASRARTTASAAGDRSLMSPARAALSSESGVQHPCGRRELSAPTTIGRQLPDVR